MEVVQLPGKSVYVSVCVRVFDVCTKGLVDSWISSIPEGKWSNRAVSMSVCVRVYLYQVTGGQLDP